MDKSHLEPYVSVVGAGLAGSECALQLANMGIDVVLYEMREVQQTPAHKTTDFAELVCSNSFGSLGPTSAPFQLKWEAEKLGSFILKEAYANMVPAGQALAVDREVFAKKITEKVKAHLKIKVVPKIVESLDEVPRPAVIATGPLTNEKLAASLQLHFGSEFLYFFDAISPIIDTDTIDTNIAWKQDRYDKGPADYLNCPMSKDQYFNFVNEVLQAKKIEPKHFETTPFFEGCMPIETMAERGIHTLRFGPMKPVGLIAPCATREPFAVVQLRQDNEQGTAYNMVGFQTRMTYSEQVRVFRTIPGLENAEFLKLGSIHRNLYIHSPELLNKDLSSKHDPFLFFAGQITGVEGYFESTCMGLMVANFLKQKLRQTSPVLDDRSFPPPTTAIGALLKAITTDSYKTKNFQPTNINFGLLPPPPNEIREKAVKKARQLEIAKNDFALWQAELTQL